MLRISRSLGFTLVELLVVIAVIGVLATVALSTFNNSIHKGNDAKRKDALHTLQNALQAYYSDNGAFPSSCMQPDTWFSSKSGGSWIPGLAPNYLKSIPLDPKNNGPSGTRLPWNSSTTYYIAYWSCNNWNGFGYLLSARMENNGDPQAGNVVKSDTGNTFPSPVPYAGVLFFNDP